MIKNVFIPGIPIVKQRPRFSKNGHAYDPNAPQKEASLQKAKITGAEQIFLCALEVHFRFAFPRPKSHYGTGKNANILKASAPIYCTNEKDIDNLEKFYADAFNCILWRDDAQIVKTQALKRWTGVDEVPHVLITVMTLEDK